MHNNRNIIKSISNLDLAIYISAQLNHFFPDNDKVLSETLLYFIDSVEEKAIRCFAGIPKKYFHDGNNIYFNHLQSDQYAMYLCILSRYIAENSNDQNIATKLYYLNKSLHSIDIYFRTELPDIFLFVHPLGSILGRAKFADYFVMYQGCTVGCLNDGIFPEFTGPTIMYANSNIMGECTIGKNVCIASGVSVINTNIPDNTIVLGNYPDYIFKENNKSIFERPPFKYNF